MGGLADLILSTGGGSYSSAYDAEGLKLGQMGLSAEKIRQLKFENASLARQSAAMDKLREANPDLYDKLAPGGAEPQKFSQAMGDVQVQGFRDDASKRIAAGDFLGANGPLAAIDGKPLKLSDAIGGAVMNPYALPDQEQFTTGFQRAETDLRGSQGKQAIAAAVENYAQAGSAKASATASYAQADNSRANAAKTRAEQGRLGLGDAIVGGVPVRPAKPLPPAIMKQATESREALRASESMIKTMTDAQVLLKGGDGKAALNTSPVARLGGLIGNVSGYGTGNTRGLLRLKQIREKLRSDYLLLSKGVQTEGDAKRAMEAMLPNTNDPQAILDQVKVLGESAAALAKVHDESLRQVEQEYGRTLRDNPGQQSGLSAADQAELQRLRGSQK